MIITLDCETQSLNAQHFLMGVLYFENGKYETFRSKHLLYDRLLDIITRENKRHKKVTIYGHNLQYDYIAIGAHLDYHNIIYSDSPFIADHVTFEANGYKTEHAKWIDTIGLWRGSLEELGKAIGEPKMPTPEWLTLDTYSPTSSELSDAETYMIHDARLLMHFVLGLRGKLWKEGIRPRLLITTPQIALSYFTSYLSKIDTAATTGFYDDYRYIQPTTWFADATTGSYHMTAYPEKILEAYRGGRVEAFRTGSADGVTSIDVNSLYPYIASTMRCPDLRTETYHTATDDSTVLSSRLSSLGISCCSVVLDQELPIGYLPLRTHATKEDEDEITTLYPRTPCLLTGTWTHLELSRAVTLGYRILSVHWSITWDETANPFTAFFSTLYARKLAATDGFEKQFSKLMMNGLLGKFAQHREKFTTCVVDVETLPTKKSEGWECVGQYGTQLLLRKSEGIDYKRSFVPIISVLVTAGARDFLFTALSAIPPANLWYCDTDSLLFTGDHTTKFIYGPSLGSWKVVQLQQPLVLYGKKQYLHGDTVTLNRVPKRFATPTAFLSGAVEYDDLLRLSSTPDLTLVGTRVRRVRMLEYDSVATHPYSLIDTSVHLTDSLLATLRTLLRTHHGQN